MAFLREFVVSPIIERDYRTDYMDSDQLRFEQTVRTMVAERDLEYPGKLDYTDWKYYYQHGGIYVDRSSFYFELTYIRFDAATVLRSDARRKVSCNLWTYGAVTIWLNGRKVIANDEPCYKPIMKHSFELELEKGDNELLVAFQNLGVRDTRNLFGIEVLDMEGITEFPPALMEGHDVALWLDGVRLDGNVLSFPESDYAFEVGFDNRTLDFNALSTRYRWNALKGAASFEIPEDVVYVVLRVKVGSSYMSRKFEVAEHLHPAYAKAGSYEENYRRALEDVAAVEGFCKDDKIGSYITNILSRKALGIENPKDDGEFMEVTLEQIEKRFDCSDFLLSGLIRYLKNYEVKPAMRERIENVIQNYRYWMTMKGSDAMCFWSENHSLLFYSSAMIIGDMYPDMYFPRAEMDGRGLHAYGKKLTEEWFDEFEKHGFEEFLSTVYMNVTFAALLNVVDYADDSLSARATKAVDRMLYELSLHTFQGSIIAPMGRVYRGVINPSQQAAQALMNLVDYNNPICFGEGWFAYLATSKYRIDESLKSLMTSDVDKSYSSGDALVTLKKRKDYCLTSVQSPRLDGFARWENVTLKENSKDYEGTHLYTKSFNERFHGTTFFEPGTYGYQQHMWIASLSKEAIAFVNLPGDTFDSSAMRPGYWYGNGVMPAVRQEGNVLGAVYRIPENYPVRFTHMFLPECKFDSVIYDGSWIFMKKGNGYAAIWHSNEAVRYDDELSSCELRFYGDDSAFMCFVGSADEYSDFTSFIASVGTHKVSYEASEGKLMLDDVLFTEYTCSNDKTQFI